MNQVCSGSSEEGTAILLEAVYFEQWVRFRWIAEEKDRFFIRIPEKDAALIREELPRFQTLLERMNDAEVNAEASFEAVLEYGRGQLGEALATVVAQPAFQERVARFHLWLGGRFEELETAELSFEAWKSLALEAERPENLWSGLHAEIL